MKTLEFKPYFIEPLRSMKKMSTIRKSDEGLKKGDIVCGFDLDTDMKRGKKLLEKYGVILEDTEDGFWITGVKE